MPKPFDEAAATAALQRPVEIGPATVAWAQGVAAVWAQADVLPLLAAMPGADPGDDFGADWPPSELREDSDDNGRS